jgi:hypothetical protein
MRRAADVGTWSVSKERATNVERVSFPLSRRVRGRRRRGIGRERRRNKEEKVGDVMSQGVKAFFFRVFYAIFRGKRGRPLDFRAASGYPKEDEFSQKPDLSETLGDAVKSRLRAVNSAVFEILIW